ncbi:MAG: FAD-binding oxidoreductase [Sporichthyaceae bacterium]
MHVDLKARVDGSVLLPGEPGYDQTRAIWNAVIDHHPQVIVRASTVRDVVTAVRTAREQDLEIGIRGGGHSAAGHAVPHDGLMLDLAPMGGVRIDAARQTAYVQGGALLGALDLASQRFGLATTAGNVSHTGVGGLTLGGGMGWLARQCGLACDNVVSFEVVTADGEVVRASATEHPDLYWALRGGGGNFGVVTEFEFCLHPTGTEALSVEVDFPLEQAAAAIRGWRDLNATAPRQATFTAGIGGGAVTLGYVWVGNPEASQELVAPIRALGRPIAERIVASTYVGLQTRDDVVDGHAWRRYAKGHYFRELTDQAIDVLLAVTEAGPFAPGVGLQAHGGAIDDAPEDETAFSHRDTLFELGASTGWTDPDEDEDRMDGARSFAATMAPFASGVYVNMLTDEGPTGVSRAYSPAKLARLTAVKDSYDPENVFHLNHNIKPSRIAVGG